uniref:Uncharacterized protein n=1 Tax=Cucumis melo TaxID=3656 RepID=A0A9I9EGL7_CUCME
MVRSLVQDLDLVLKGTIYLLTLKQLAISLRQLDNLPHPLPIDKLMDPLNHHQADKQPSHYVKALSTLEKNRGLDVQVLKLSASSNMLVFVWFVSAFVALIWVLFCLLLEHYCCVVGKVLCMVVAFAFNLSHLIKKSLKTKLLNI